MRIVNRQVIFERKDCDGCSIGAAGKGRQYGEKPCPACNGTGRGKRGKVRGCQECLGYRTRPDFTVTVPCAKCHGNYRLFDEEDRYDFTTPEFRADVLANVPLEVIREDRRQTFLEAYLPIGNVFAVGDYGRAWAMSDAEVVAKVRDEYLHDFTQVCHLLRSGSDELPEALHIVLTRNGYALRPAHPVTTGN